MSMKASAESKSFSNFFVSSTRKWSGIDGHIRPRFIACENLGAGALGSGFGLYQRSRGAWNERTSRREAILRNGVVAGRTAFRARSRILQTVANRTSTSVCHSRNPSNQVISIHQQQDARVIALLKSPWFILPSLFLVSSSHGGRSSGLIRCSSSSVWRIPVSGDSSVESGEAQAIEAVWKEYFADPSQWLDNRVFKTDPKSPDFKHKVTNKALWIDGWATPPWVKAMLKLVTQSKLPSDVGYFNSAYQEIVQPNRSNEGNFGRRNTWPSSARESKQTVRGGGGNLLMPSAKTTTEAINVLKNRQRQGLAIDSHVFVEVLKRCLKQKDLPAVKQVHECIIESGMQQNIYVANSLLSAYIRCGRLEVACRVFDELVKKDVVSWNIVLGGYAQHGRAKDAMDFFNEMRRGGVQPDAVTYLSILKACGSPSALQWGEEVHACIRHGGLDSDVRVGTALLRMYAKCGNLMEARKVFDKLSSRNVISWNVMIGAYADSGLGEEAYGLLLQMRREGFEPDAITYTSILNACAGAGALEWVKEVHGHVLEAGLESDLRLANSLVHMYATCGSMSDARLVFDGMKERDVVTWNVIIGAHADNGRGEEAYRLFLRMVREDFKPDAVTCINILNAYASGGALEWVKEVHSYAREAGFESDLRVGSALVNMYAKSGSFDDAREVFDRMKERDVVTWTVMIGGLAQHGCGREAYELFLRMQEEGFTPTVATYVSILNASASAGALEWVKEVHRNARERGFEFDVRVCNSLVRMYAKCGSIDDARLVFDRMDARNAVTWNMIISAYAESAYGEKAYRLYLQMIREGLKPDAITYMSILNACASVGSLNWVKDVHNRAREAGFEADVRVVNALVHMYAKCGSIDDARLVFDRIKERDVITWNVIIGAYGESGRGEEAYQLFLRMVREGLKPDAVSYVCALNACAGHGALEWVKEVHSHALEAGFELDVRVGNALVHTYAKCGSIDDARLVFDRMEERDIVTWTMMIGGLAQHGCGSEALEVFRNMNAAGLKPDGYSFVAVLSACSHAGLVDEGRRVFLDMPQDYGIVPSVLHWNCMVDILGRAGHLEEAKLLIDSMPVDPDGATWRALLSACRSHGNVELGELAAKERVKLDPEDASTYVLLSNIYAAAGKWEEASLVRTMMQERGIRKEPGRSWIAVDHKIHAFVGGDTSHPRSKEIYAELSRLTEEIKAEGYLPDTRLVLHDIGEKDKEFSVCSHSEKLAIAYGLLCSPSSESIRVYKNLRVCPDCHTATKLISKVTRKEIVVRDANRFHHFKDGLCSCKDYW